MANKILKWETEDGKLFDTELLANLHEDRQDIIESIDKNPLRTNGRTEVLGDALMNYIDKIPNVSLVYNTERT